MAAVGGPPLMGSVLVNFMVALGNGWVAGAPVSRPVGRAAGAPARGPLGRAPGAAGTGRAGAWASGMVLLPIGAGGAGGPPMGRVGGGGAPPMATVGAPAGRIGGGALRSGTVGAPGATARGDGGGADGNGMAVGVTGT
jgi:hypothetical protein